MSQLVGLSSCHRLISAGIHLESFKLSQGRTQKFHAQYMPLLGHLMYRISALFAFIGQQNCLDFLSGLGLGGFRSDLDCFEAN